MRQAHTVPIMSAKNVICVAANHVRPEDVCEAAGLDPSLLGDRSARIPTMQLVKLYECAARLTKDPSFGLHVGARNDFRMLGTYGYLLMHSPTLGDALHRAARYSSIWSDGVVTRFETEGSTARFIWEYADRSITDSRHNCEGTCLSCAKFVRLLTGGHWKPREVRFHHAMPKDVSEHRKMFEAPVQFRAPANELIFDKAALAFASRGADPELGEVLVQHAEHLLAACKEETLIGRAESALYGSLRNGRLGLDCIAHSMGMSTRSLQRALNNEGISYQGLLANVRRELAQRYLEETAKSIKEIAFLLGYSHPSEFHRAFRSWTGIPPRSYRRWVTIARTRGLTVEKTPIPKTCL